MIDYIRAHWHGELSLAQSYWVNLVALSALVIVASALLEEPFSSLSVQDAVVAGLAILVVASIVTIWQFVGVWRSATKTAIKTKRSFWPTLAKTLTVLGCSLAAINAITTTSDLLRLHAALRDPTLVDYAVERLGDTDLIFTGAINEASASALIKALEDPSIEILRVNSHGGLVPAAILLSRHIRANNIMVMAEGQCISACVMLLAASPYAAIYPGTQVTFHRFEPVAEFTNPEVRAQNRRFLTEAEGVYKEFGVAEWAIQTAGRQQFWTPTVDQQIAMGLIVLIYDADQSIFVDADEYCANHAAQCAE